MPRRDTISALLDELRAQQLPPPEDRKAIRLGADPPLSASRCAKALGVSELSFRNWENGRARPRPDHALLYRKFLDGLARRAS